MEIIPTINFFFLIYPIRSYDHDNNVLIEK